MYFEPLLVEIYVKLVEILKNQPAGNEVIRSRFVSENNLLMNTLVKLVFFFTRPTFAI